MKSTGWKSTKRRLDVRHVRPVSKRPAFAGTDTIDIQFIIDLLNSWLAKKAALQA